MGLDIVRFYEFLGFLGFVGSSFLRWVFIVLLWWFGLWCYMIVVCGVGG